MPLVIPIGACPRAANAPASCLSLSDKRRARMALARRCHRKPPRRLERTPLYANSQPEHAARTARDLTKEPPPEAAIPPSAQATQHAIGVVTDLGADGHDQECSILSPSNPEWSPASPKVPPTSSCESAPATETRGIRRRIHNSGTARAYRSAGADQPPISGVTL